MQSNDKMKLHGAMSATLIKADGSTETLHKDNIIVNVGFDFIANAIGASAARPAVMSHIAIGSGTTAASVGQTALVTELTRGAATYAHTTGTKTFTFTANFAAGVGTGAITEAGVLNAASGGILLDRVVFAVINKAALDTLQVTFTFTMS